MRLGIDEKDGRGNFWRLIVICVGGLFTDEDENQAAMQKDEYNKYHRS
jgi:hypothetical protein